MSNHYLRIFTQPKSAILLILGFASGLPLALTSGTLQAWMTVENIDLKTIGFFSLVGQAYVFKFLWSPVMDRYTPPFLGRRRGWLLATQFLLLIAIAAMGFLEPSTQLRWMAALAVVIAFCSASQDIVFDAWKTDVLAAEERGTGAAISVLGYRLGMLVSGGLALWLADRWLGWQGMYWLMAALLIPCIIATLLAPEPSDVIPVPKTLEQAVADGLQRLLDTARAGVPASRLAEAWTFALAEHGLTKPSRLGYSIGIGYPPDWGERTMSIRSEESTVLEPNMTFHVICSMWISGAGYGVSESVRITETGVEIFTLSPRGWDFPPREGA